MKIMKIQGVIAAVLLCLCSVTSWADELTTRVDFVSKQLGCEFPYLVAEDSETGRFYAETKLKNPQRLKIQGFPDAERDDFVSIQESVAGEYWIKVVPEHRMLDVAEEKLFVVELKPGTQSPAEIIASGITIKGVIANLADVRDDFSPSTYLQLVEASPAGQPREIVVDGFLNLDSNLPRIPIATDGSFEIRTVNIKPGSYWLYLQNFKSAEATNHPFEAILAKGGKYFQIFISGDVKSLIFDCGNLTVKQP